MKIYNKNRNEFKSIDEYNKYLEDIEDKICCLIEGIEVDQIKKRNKWLYECESCIDRHRKLKEIWIVESIKFDGKSWESKIML